MGPKINAGMEELRNQMARGAAGPTAGNISPAPPGMSPMGTPKGMAGGLRTRPAGIPAGPGVTPSAGTSAAGSPAIKSSTPTLDTVKTHGLALGGLKHLLKAQPHEAKHINRMMAHSNAHVASYRSSAKKTAPTAPPKARFGALAAGPSPVGGGQPDGPY